MIDALTEYSRLLFSLRDMINKGEGDSSAAEDLRDRMDFLWAQLSEIECSLIRNMSKIIDAQE